MLFINAQNKQTTWRIAKPLRDIGVPAAIVVDLDVLKEGGSNWANILNGGHVPPLQAGVLGQFRGEVMRAFSAAGVDPKAKNALASLSPVDAEAVQNLIEQLFEYGIFVVPVGELERWLPSLGAVGRKGDWLADVFAKMGSDTNSATFVQPSEGDVWQFVGEVSSWVRNSNRKGLH